MAINRRSRSNFEACQIYIPPFSKNRNSFLFGPSLKIRTFCLRNFSLMGWNYNTDYVWRDGDELKAQGAGDVLVFNTHLLLSHFSIQRLAWQPESRFLNCHQPPSISSHLPILSLSLCPPSAAGWIPSSPTRFATTSPSPSRWRPSPRALREKELQLVQLSVILGSVNFVGGVIRFFMDKEVNSIPFLAPMNINSFSRNDSCEITEQQCGPASFRGPE